MPASITILFPNGPDAQYNIEYYQQHPMPLIETLWSSFSITSWSVTTFTPSPDGTPSAFAFGSAANWDDEESIQKAFSTPETHYIMKDVSNFSNKEPVFLFGNVFE
ncbi:hypothetical protein EDB80DRAFT_867583 [Ilyonectria destructans]|nr:hypothetical protein EDB80DRAFT_867583 [Ilyonectria destructans]